MSQLIHVAVAVIRNARNDILISRRHADSHQGGLWEFPGGKLKRGESLQQALERELREELGIEIGAIRPLLEIEHDYGDRRVLLDVWLVREFSGEARGLEGQPLNWVAPAELANYAFPAANRPILEAIAGLD